MYNMQKRPIDLYPFEIVYLLPSGAEIKKYLPMYSSSLKLLSLHRLKKNNLCKILPLSSFKRSRYFLGRSENEIHLRQRDVLRSDITI